MFAIAALAVAAAGLSCVAGFTTAQAQGYHGGGRHWRGNGGPYRYGPYRYGPYRRGPYGPWLWGGYYGYWPFGPAYPPPPVYYGPPPPVYAPPPPRPPPPQPVERAAPPPASAVEPERFVVLFPFDRAEITAEARAIIGSAADYQRRVGGHVIIVGHTDTSGSEAYNWSLSERRSRAVRAALGAAGVDAATVEMDWKGKHDLAVPTGDGVKELRNRRVTILVERRG
jgi:outer membrane protein OmpA-like peptidoglycan-associated protein